MTTGIYSLIFGGTYVYIGKSINIETRWKQHWDKMVKGKAAANVQEVFNRYGEPQASVVVECHPDHIDLLETLVIRHNKHLNLLNSAGTANINEEDGKVLIKNGDLIVKSTADHIREIVNLREYVEDREEVISNYKKNGIVLPPDTAKLVKENKDLIKQRDELIKVNRLLSQEAAKSWWQRLFS